MRTKFAFPLALAALSLAFLLLEPGRGTSQPPGNKGGNKGGMPSPEDTFKFLAGEKDHFLLSELPFWFREKDKFAKWATDQGIKDGKISKDVFLKYKDQENVLRFEERAKGRGYFLTSEMKGGFQKGMDDFLLLEGVKDGKMSKDLYLKYVGALTAGRKKDDQKTETKAPDAKPADPKPAETKPSVVIKTGVKEVDASEDTALLISRFGKLPDGLPDWFKKLDLDNDGQVSIFEWKKADKDMDQFLKIDRNDDGFLTAEEVLRDLRITASQKTGATQQTAATPEKKDTEESKEKKKKKKF